MIELKALTLEDGLDVFEMIKEIGEGGNGFENSLLSDTFDQFKEKLHRNDQLSKGVGLEGKYVPQTVYWLYVDGKPVGYGKFRHYLNDNLRNHGGNIGYVVRPSERKKGYATILLREIIKKAKETQLDQVLVTCNETNVASKKVIEANNGVLEKRMNGTCFYWITF